MEFALNVCWLLLAAIAYVFFCKQWLSTRSEHRRQSHYCSALALGCAMVLLFPVVSLSDDLVKQASPGDPAFSERQEKKQFVRSIVNISTNQACVPYFRLSVDASLRALLEDKIDARHAGIGILPPDWYRPPPSVVRIGPRLDCCMAKGLTDGGRHGFRKL